MAAAGLLVDPDVVLPENIPQSLLIKHTQHGMHLFPVHAGGKLAVFGKRPRAGYKIGVIAFIQLKAPDAHFYQGILMIAAEYLPSPGIERSGTNPPKLSHHRCKAANPDNGRRWGG